MLLSLLNQTPNNHVKGTSLRSAPDVGRWAHGAASIGTSRKRAARHE